MQAAPDRSALTHTGKARVGTYVAKSGETRDVELAYDVFGSRGRPVVLIMGIGCQRVFWDDELCRQFVAAGFHVVRFDHRDIGESTRLDAVVPPPWPLLARRFAGFKVDAPYTLSSMAADVVGLVHALGWRDPPVVGTSPGGSTGPHTAADHPG